MKHPITLVDVTSDHHWLTKAKHRLLQAAIAGRMTEALVSEELEACPVALRDDLRGTVALLRARYREEGRR